MNTQSETMKELHHLRANWLWVLLLGILIATCGTATLIFPGLTILTTFAAILVLGIALMVAGVATLIGAFWAGKWSGFFLQLLCGILYIVSGLMISGAPKDSAALITLLLAALFIVLGLFRVIVAMMFRFPHWGWTLLNGAITLLLGVVIYRHFSDEVSSAFWVVGMLVGVEMLLHGWTWIMLAVAIHRLPEEV